MKNLGKIPVISIIIAFFILIIILLFFLFFLKPASTNNTNIQSDSSSISNSFSTVESFQTIIDNYSGCIDINCKCRYLINDDCQFLREKMVNNKDYKSELDLYGTNVKLIKKIWEKEHAPDPYVNSGNPVHIIYYSYLLDDNCLILTFIKEDNTWKLVGDVDPGDMKYCTLS